MVDSNGSIGQITQINPNNDDKLVVKTTQTDDARVSEDIVANVAVGAVKVGEQIDKNTNFTALVKKLLIADFAPEITFTGTGSGLNEEGVPVTTPTLTTTITNAGTAIITKIQFFEGNTQLGTDQPFVNGTNVYTEALTSDVSANATFKTKVFYKFGENGTEQSIDAQVTYTFVNATYVGVTAGDTIDATLIKTLDKKILNGKGTTYTATVTNGKVILAYPASFGDLSDIKDQNNFSLLGSYTKNTMDIDTVSYNVYISTNKATLNGYKLNFVK